MGVQHEDDPVAPMSATESGGRLDRQFAAIVNRLRRDDPEFRRRCSVPRTWGFARVDVMIIVATVAVIALGIAPVAVGLHLHALALLIAGTVGCVVAPTLVPWVVGRAIVRHRPLWA